MESRLRRNFSLRPLHAPAHVTPGEEQRRSRGIDRRATCLFRTGNFLFRASKQCGPAKTTTGLLIVLTALPGFEAACLLAVNM